MKIFSQSNITKKMHLPGSCAYAALSILLEDFGIDVTDVDIIRAISLPFMFKKFRTEHEVFFKAGTDLQGKEWFDLFLLPHGLEFVENTYSKESLIQSLNRLDLKHVKVMIGLRSEYGKHAHVLTGIDDTAGEYIFISPDGVLDSGYKYVILGEQELLNSLDDSLVAGYIRKGSGAQIDYFKLFADAIADLEDFRITIADFLSRPFTKKEIEYAKITLFFPLLVSVFYVLELTNYSDFRASLLELSREFQRISADNLGGFSHQFKESILSAIDQYFDIITMLKQKLD